MWLYRLSGIESGRGGLNAQSGGEQAPHLPLAPLRLPLPPPPFPSPPTLQTSLVGGAPLAPLPTCGGALGREGWQGECACHPGECEALDEETAALFSVSNANMTSWRELCTRFADLLL